MAVALDCWCARIYRADWIWNEFSVHATAGGWSHLQVIPFHVVAREALALVVIVTERICIIGLPTGVLKRVLLFVHEKAERAIDARRKRIVEEDSWRALTTNC